MVIKKISKTKTNKYKVEFSDDQKITTYDDVIINNGLLKEKTLSSDDISKIFEDTEYYDVYYKLVKYLTKKMRSEKEVKEYLEKFELKESDNDKIIYNLKKIKLINDTNFAKAYTNDKFNLSSYGPNKIKKDLESHNINNDLVCDTISNICEGEICDKVTKLIKKKINSNKKDSSYFLKQKVLTDLINKGYDKDLISSIYETLEKGDKDIILKNIHKLKQKNPQIDRREIFDKLYKKGFKTSDLNDVLNELEM